MITVIAGLIFAGFITGFIYLIVSSRVAGKPNKKETKDIWKIVGWGWMIIIVITISLGFAS